MPKDIVERLQEQARLPLREFVSPQSILNSITLLEEAAIELERERDATLYWEGRYDDLLSAVGGTWPC